MSNGNGTLTPPRLVDRPPRPARRWDYLLQGFIAVVLVYCLSVLCFGILPQLTTLSRQAERMREADAKRAAEEKEAVRVGDGARTRYVEQQAAIVEQAKRTRELLAANEELADRLHKRLKEMER